jgi:hypothetical protein
MSMTSLSLSEDYWENLSLQPADVEFVQTYLFENEMPLTGRELLPVFVQERIRLEREAQAKATRGKSYLPREMFKKGDALIFPALNSAQGTVKSIREGKNPEMAPFQVLEVEMQDGEMRAFAAGLESHALNDAPEPLDDPSVNVDAILATYAEALEARLEDALSGDESLVRIAGRWFPRALLVDVNAGHLNLAEAVLEMAGGEPMDTRTLMEQLELPASDNANLIAFSLNFALQEDPRFDEVGPAGQVLWCLKRLEPEQVQNPPAFLRPLDFDYDRDALTDDMLALERELDDELSDVQDFERTEEATLCLTYPHWRAGTLPISPRLQQFFPTAYESPRIRFTLIDAQSGERIPAWVVREHRYVYGVQEWIKKQDLIPGALITVRHGQNPGEVILDAKTHRATREWIRTAIPASDGGVVFAVLRQNVGCDYNERMALYVTDVEVADLVWERAAKNRNSLEYQVAPIVRELSKLTPQGHVHAQELYSAFNLLRRCPPAPIFAVLASSPLFHHVGDLHFRLSVADDEENI